MTQRRSTSLASRALSAGAGSPHPAILDLAAPGKRRIVPTSVAPITFFVREDADWMTPRREAGDEATRGLSPDAQAVAQFLHRHGASFFTDIVRGTGKLKAEVETALWELVAGGLLTADGFDNLRALIDPKRRAGHGRGRSARPRHSAGRWSLLYSGEAVDRPRAVEATCWMLLRRYGVVFRDVLVRETLLPSWRELLITLRRLEDRGEVRGGRFVSGFLGEQFALPVAVESLRALRDLPPSGETIAVSAADARSPGTRIPTRLSGSAAETAMEDLSAAFLGSNSLCLWRWNRSARCATFRPRAKPSQFLPPTRLTSWVFWFQASARRPLPEDLSLFATALPCRRRKEQESSRWPRHAEPPRVAYLLPHETSKSHF